MQTNHKELTPVDQQVIMLVVLKVRPEKSATFMQAVLDDLNNARQEAGYISMNLFRTKDDPNTLFLLEQWQNQSALNSHLAQPYTKTVLELTETSLTAPLEIHYLETISASLNFA